MIEQDPRQMRRPGSEQAKLAEAASECVDVQTFFRAVVAAICVLVAQRQDGEAATRDRPA